MMGYKFTRGARQDLRNDHSSPSKNGWEEWHRSLFVKVFLAILILPVFFFPIRVPHKIHRVLLVLDSLTWICWICLCVL